MLVQLQYGAAEHDAWTRVFTGTLSRMIHVSTQEVPVRPLFLGKEQGKSGLGGGAGEVGLAITRTREVALRRQHWCGSTEEGSGPWKRLMTKGSLKKTRCKKHRIFNQD